MMLRLHLVTRIHPSHLRLVLAQQVMHPMQELSKQQDTRCNDVDFQHAKQRGQKCWSKLRMIGMIDTASVHQQDQGVLMTQNST